MLIRHLLKALKNEKQPHLSTLPRYLFSDEAEEVEEEALENDESVVEEGHQETDKTKRRRREVSAAKQYLDQVSQYNVMPTFSKYILFQPKFKVTKKMVNKLKSIEGPQQRVQYMERLYKKYLERRERPLINYSKQMSLDFFKLQDAIFLQNDERFEIEAFGTKQQIETATLRLAKLKAFDLVDSNVINEYIKNNNTKKLLEFYKTGFYTQTVFIPSTYQMMADRILNPEARGGLYVNIIFEAFKQEIQQNLYSGVAFYQSLPISLTHIKSISQKINNNDLPDANPFKFYWCAIHSDGDGFQNFGHYLLLLMRKLRVNGYEAENYIASLSNLFISQKVVTQLLHSIFKANFEPETFISSWGITLIMLSRIQSIVSSIEAVEKVNFDDLFNLLREINEHNYEFIKHGCPKILYEKCDPEIFMVYQKALKHYDDKQGKNPVAYYQESKLQSLWNLTGKTHQGFHIEFYFPQDPLKIQNNVSEVEEGKNYHLLDKFSDVTHQMIQDLKQKVPDAKKNLQRLELFKIGSQMMPDDDEERKQMIEKLKINETILQGMEIKNKEKKFIEKTQKLIKQNFFHGLDKSITRDIIQGNFSKGLDYVRLLLAEDVNENYKELQGYLVEAFSQSRKLGYKPESNEQALYVLKQIEKKWIYRELSDPVLNNMHSDPYDSQGEVLQPFQEDLLEAFAESDPDFEKKLDNQLREHVKEAPEGYRPYFEEDKEDQQNFYEENEKQEVKEQIRDKKKKSKGRASDQSDKVVDSLEGIQEHLDARRDKKKNWKDRSQIYQKDKEKPAGLFSKKHKKFSTMKEFNEEDQPSGNKESYESYLKQSKQIETEMKLFDFSRTSSFAEVSREFTQGIKKIDENNMKHVIEKYQNIPVVGNISVLLKYHFLKSKSATTTYPDQLKIKFETSLGEIEKDYGVYLQNSTFMFKFPIRFYNELLADQLSTFNRKQFKKIVAHYALFMNEISPTTIRLLCEVCGKQKIGVTLIEILELFTNRDIKTDYEGVKLMAAGVQRYRNLENDLLNFLKKYCKKYGYDIEARIFEPYIESIVKSEEYEKLNNFLEMLRFELKPKGFKIDDNLSPEQNLAAEKKFKETEKQRFKNENFIMLDLVCQNFKERTEIPPFIIELFDDYANSLTTPMSSRQLGAGLLIYSQDPEKLNNHLEIIRKGGKQNDVYVFECALKVLRLFGRKMSDHLKDILGSTLYLNRIQLTPDQAHTLAQIFKELDMPNAYNEYLEFLLRHQPVINPQTKRLYYLIFNRTSDQYSKNQMNNVLDMLFNEKKEKQRIEFKATQEEEERKAEYLKNLANVEFVSSKSSQGTVIKDGLPVDIETLENKPSKKKKEKSASKEKKAPAKVVEEASGFRRNADNKFVYSAQLSKKKLRNKSLRAFLLAYMQKYEKTEGEEDGKDDKKGKKAKGKK